MSILGLRGGIVKLVPHKDEWAILFEEEKKILQDNLGSKVLEVEHFGSTAIPNIPAKPIMNICIKIDSFEKIFDLKNKLSEIGYQYKPTDHFDDHELFFKEENGEVTHHLHFMSVSGKNWQKAILFKNYLLENPEEARKYGHFKLQLARRFPNDRKAYGEGKNQYIKAILSKIM